MEILRTPFSPAETCVQVDATVEADSDGEPQRLDEVLEDVVKNTKGDTTTVGDLLRPLKHQSFGPLILLPAVLVLIPLIGGIPLLPGVIAVILILICGQILFGRTHPWLPRKLREFEVSQEKLQSGIDRARPWARRVNKIVGRRLEFLTGSVAAWFVALCCIAMSLLFFPLGFIPFAVSAPASVIALFGLGLTARDGLLVLLGFLGTGGSVWLSIYLWPKIIDLWPL